MQPRVQWLGSWKRWKARMLAMAMALTSLGLVPQPRASHDLNVYITISGEFEGSGKWAEILPVTDSSGQEVWALRTRLGQGDLEAQARCFLFDQR